MVTEAEWERIQGELRFGQVVTGTVVRVPRPGTIGIFVDIGLGVEGFVDVVLLPRTRIEDWPAEGTVTDFEIWWVHKGHQQIRLKPSDPKYLCEDFADFVARYRPAWPSEIGEVVRSSKPSTP
ncbi:S1 RNA-binding domain-containing protein [Streptomyces sp. Ncost-T10-10d]|uniref:S1 RNA-binding domain-containing protein n=1 Tax=Streptomyces sp. Ncost-T10-10d TaxID=1839774 RepID=UPI000B86B58A|nr:S1 RNA-binding domain-containing protein [Streptomyces sp. Ncost-T10-10d]